MYTVIPISPFNLITPDHPIKTGDFILIGVGIHEGTEVIYYWKLGNEDLKKTVKKFWHVYNNPGIFHIEVTASNSNNTYEKNGVIVVQDPVNGLKCVADTTALLPMEETLIKWVIRKGIVNSSPRLTATRLSLPIFKQLGVLRVQINTKCIRLRSVCVCVCVCVCLIE